tara:strand:- start:449 stop:763 length:315 start_codon:yes stop_codon:yes gene_type:complete
MGRLKQLMIEEMDMANEHGDLMGDGIMFTTHPTDHMDWYEIKSFVDRLCQYYALIDREIIAVKSYHNSGWDFMSNSQEKPPENGIEIQWKPIDRGDGGCDLCLT